VVQERLRQEQARGVHKQRRVLVLGRQLPADRFRRRQDGHRRRARQAGWDWQA
jgi:hypothetical protein